MSKQWLRRLAATVRSCWLWHSPALRLGVRYRRPMDRYDHWEVWAYPAVQEVGGGRNDGGTVWSGFTVDVSQLLGELDVGQIGLSTAMADDPPELAIEGMFRGRAVLIHLCLEPPADAEATEILDLTRPGEARVRRRR